MACVPHIFFPWWSVASNWVGAVEGATTTMYFGDHRGLPNSFRIYRQQEASRNIDWVDRAIPSWRLEEGSVCPSADGQNWCSRSSSIVRAGWISKGEVGFMWQALQGNGFPFPYVEAAVFSEDHDLAYVRRPYLWSSAGAFHYPFISPNARGDLGLTVYFSTADSFPAHTLAFRTISRRRDHLHGKCIALARAR